MLIAKARATSSPCSDLRAGEQVEAKAAIPIATASFAVPGIWPADSEA